MNDTTRMQKDVLKPKKYYIIRKRQGDENFDNPLQK